MKQMKQKTCYFIISVSFLKQMYHEKLSKIRMMVYFLYWLKSDIKWINQETSMNECK